MANDCAAFFGDPDLIACVAQRVGECSAENVGLSR